MIAINLHTIASILNAKHIGIDIIIDYISIDSNIIKNKCMFIALIGKRFDGHNFAEQAVIAGAKAILVNRILSLDVPQVIVMDTHYALMKLSNWVRCQVSSKIIAITGSSGKTSVKEMTRSILENCGTVVATQGNYNNLIGVPITLLCLTKQHRFAVIELGTSRPGELYQLSKIVVADVAIVNNIHPSHLLNFGSIKSIKKEKGEIFSGLINTGQAIINNDSHAYSLWYAMLQKKYIWRFSLSKKIGSDFFASNIIFTKNGMRFILHNPCGVTPIFLSMLGLHNVVNAVAASALAFSVGANLPAIIDGLENMKAFPGRLFPIILNKGKLLLLDDTYNSNVGSMIAAIHVLNKMSGYRILIISDMLELGKSKSIKYHHDISKLIIKTNIDQVLTIGDYSHFVSRICKKGKHFQNKTALILYLRKILLQYEYMSILIKGSRSFYMEQVIDSIKDYVRCYSG